jgi:Na+-translocating ferredoxin:NAD+ oxidoreductase RnfG subunit
MIAKIRNINMVLLLAGSTLLLTTVGCTTENWYRGAQAAQTTQCMKQPLSEYDDCNEQTKQSYDSYEEEREQILKENK